MNEPTVFMKAAFIDDYGSKEKIIIGEQPKPFPGEGEVLIKIKAAGVNPVDWKIREGRLKDRLPNYFPIILGWDMAGTIEELGYGARRFKVGDPVFAYCRRPVIQKGTYAEYIALPECYLSLKPKNTTFEQAAAVPLASLTAYQALFERAKLKPQETVLIIGASGGVGSFAVQFAKNRKAKVIAVTSAKNHRYLKSLGASIVLDYARGDYHGQFKELFPKGVDVVLACAGGDALIKGYDCVKKGGRLVTIVEKGDEQIGKEKGFEFLYHFVEANSCELDLIREWIEKKKIKVHLAQVFSIRDVKKAHEQIETGHTRGKIVLRMDL